MAVEELVADVGAFIIAGRQGSADARGTLFERCRNYLLLVAERELDPGLCGKLGASDLVQQTFLDAEQGFGKFRGKTEPELLAWLYRILENRAGQAVRQYRLAAKRDLRGECSLASWTDRSGDLQLAADIETPSREVAAAEEADRLTAARAFSRSPQLGSSSFAAGTHRDCGLAALGAPIGCQPMMHRVMAAISSGSSNAALPVDPPPITPSVDPGRGVIDPPSIDRSDSRADFRN